VRVDIIRIAVKLKAPDPAAVTAEYTLRRLMPAECPVCLERYDLWEFHVSRGGRESVSEVVGHFTDIVNPNKQKFIFLEEASSIPLTLPGENPELTWVGIVISDHDNSISENWTSVMVKRGFPVEKVRFETLWRLAWPSGTPPLRAEAMAMAVSESTTRNSGLLGNPVSQSITLQRGI